MKTLTRIFDPAFKLAMIFAYALIAATPGLAQTCPANLVMCSPPPTTIPPSTAVPRCCITKPASPGSVAASGRLGMAALAPVQPAPASGSRTGCRQKRHQLGRRLAFAQSNARASSSKPAATIPPSTTACFRPLVASVPGRVSATYAGNTANAWFVNFGNGNFNINVKAVSYYVRLVRGGQSFGSFDALGVPGAPVIGTATAGNAQATVTFTAPTDNGNYPAISGYTVTANPVAARTATRAAPV